MKLLQPQMEEDLFAIFEITKPTVTPTASDSQCRVCINCGSSEPPVIKKHSKICSDCGHSEIIQEQTKSWSAQHQERRKNDSKDLFSDIAGKGFSDNIAQTANEIFVLIISGRTRRSASRLGIICGCIFDSYKINAPLHQMALDYSIIYGRFNMGRKAALKGLKEVALCLAIHHRESDVYMRLAYCNSGARAFISNYACGLTTQKDAAELICSLFNQLALVEHMGRARPQTVAAGLVYYWIKEENKPIALEALMQVSGLKKNTIEKIEADIRKKMSNMIAGRAVARE